MIAEVAATLEPGTEDVTERQEKFEALIDRFEATEDPIRHGMATVMLSFLAGLFVGEEEYEGIRDNLDLERWFRLPKSHERRIHGRRHAGVRLVQTGRRWCMRWTPTRRTRAVYGGRPVAVSGGPRAALPNSGVEPPQDHEEGTIEEATAVTPGRPGAALSGIAVILALLRIVVFFRVPMPGFPPRTDDMATETSAGRLAVVSEFRENFNPRTAALHS